MQRKAWSEAFLADPNSGPKPLNIACPKMHLLCTFGVQVELACEGQQLPTREVSLGAKGPTKRVHVVLDLLERDPGCNEVLLLLDRLADSRMADMHNA